MANIDDTIGLWCEGDFRPEMPTVSGRRALLQRLMVRLQTPRGRFSGVSSDGKSWGWVNFGTDLAAFLNSKAAPTVIASAAESECLKDEQVDACQVVATVEDNGRRIRLVIVIIDSEGPFTFTLGIEQAKLTLIELQAV